MSPSDSTHVKFFQMLLAIFSQSAVFIPKTKTCASDIPWCFRILLVHRIVGVFQNNAADLRNSLSITWSCFEGSLLTVTVMFRWALELANSMTLQTLIEVICSICSHKVHVFLSVNNYNELCVAFVEHHLFNCVAFNITINIQLGCHFYHSYFSRYATRRRPCTISAWILVSCINICLRL